MSTLTATASEPRPTRTETTFGLVCADGQIHSRHRTRALAHATGRRVIAGGPPITIALPLRVTGPSSIVPGGSEPLALSPLSPPSVDHREGDASYLAIVATRGHGGGADRDDAVSEGWEDLYDHGWREGRPRCEDEPY